MHVLTPSHVEPVQTACIELMREVAFKPFAPLPLHPLATLAMNTAPIIVYRFLLRLFAVPVAGSTIRLGNVSSHFDLAETHHHIVTVISLVGHHLFHACRMYFILAFGVSIT